MRILRQLGRAKKPIKQGPSPKEKQMSNVTITDLRSHLRSDITFGELDNGQFFTQGYNKALLQKVENNPDSKNRWFRAIRLEGGTFSTPCDNTVVTPVSVEILIKENL